MFFVLSKMIGFFTVPSNAVTVLCVVGLVLLATRFHRAGRRVLALGVVSLFLLGCSPLANILMLPLTERFPAWKADGRTPDGIIVLGGAIDADTTVVRGDVQMDSASSGRVIGMLELARRYPSARVVYTGGSGNLLAGSESEAPVAGALLERFGVSRDRVVLEGDSRTTSENAIFTRRLVQPKPGELWLLVTSAFHMPRSIGAFRKAGFDVEAYPMDWRMRGWGDATTLFNNASNGLSRSDTAVHEWIGLFAYWVTGRSSELFPGPK